MVRHAVDRVTAAVGGLYRRVAERLRQLREVGYRVDGGLDGVPYHRVKVTFRQEGGGRDWEDVFMYWFRMDTNAMDYLAYAFGQGPGEEPGTRFREAYNVRRVNGVRMADYRNYTVDTLSADQMEEYPDLWARDAARLVSRIELDSVQVRPL